MSFTQLLPDLSFNCSTNFEKELHQLSIAPPDGTINSFAILFHHQPRCYSFGCSFLLPGRDCERYR
jgi:hypothetical protein